MTHLNQDFFNIFYPLNADFEGFFGIGLSTEIDIWETAVHT